MYLTNVCLSQTHFIKYIEYYYIYKPIETQDFFYNIDIGSALSTFKFNRRVPLAIWEL